MRRAEGIKLNLVGLHAINTSSFLGAWCATGSILQLI